MKTDNKNTIVDCTELFYSIQKEHPNIELWHLAMIAMGYRGMLEHGGVDGTPVGISEDWMMSNVVYCDYFNKVHEQFGDSVATAIRDRIRQYIDVKMNRKQHRK